MAPPPSLLLLLASGLPHLLAFRNCSQTSPGLSQGFHLAERCQCEAVCSLAPSCLYYLWQEEEGRCSLESSSPRAALLLEGVVAGARGEVEVEGLLPVWGLVEGGRAEDCRRRCELERECKAWSWGMQEERKVCVLHTNIETIFPPSSLLTSVSGGCKEQEKYQSDRKRLTSKKHNNKPKMPSKLQAYILSKKSTATPTTQITRGAPTPATTTTSPRPEIQSTSASTIKIMTSTSAKTMMTKKITTPTTTKTPFTRAPTASTNPKRQVRPKKRPFSPKRKGVENDEAGVVLLCEDCQEDQENGASSKKAESADLPDMKQEEEPESRTENDSAALFN